MTAVLLAVVGALGGEQAVGEVMSRAGTTRSREYLLDTGNWISYDEAIELWRAGALVTHHPQFARLVGEEAGRRLNGSPVAALLRSLGSPERVYRELGSSSSRFSTVSDLKAVAVGAEFAEIVVTPVPGFPRSADHCAWTAGLLTAPPALFGLAPAVIEHAECAVFGAPACRYRASWVVNGEERQSDADQSAQERGLHAQIAGMEERLRAMFATAADLIAADGIDSVLARITERAAVEVRAPRYLLAVRDAPGGELHCHQRGFSAHEAAELTERILSPQPGPVPESWLVVPIRSNRQDYGQLLAMYTDGQQFFPRERELLEVYARYAASALDSATALTEAKRLHAQSSALLELARALAKAGTTGEVAGRLADAVPVVVDCDRVAVYLWDQARGEIVRRATSAGDPERAPELPEDISHIPYPDGPVKELLSSPSREPILIDAEHGDPAVRAHFARLGLVATIFVPLVGADSFLGLLAVSVYDREDRLKPTPNLLDLLSGVAAQATTALQNGQLVDAITHQARHDSLTGLANRRQFTFHLRSTIQAARRENLFATLFYIDLDGFKPVNDELGHEIGDELLAAVAQRLGRCVRVEDNVARLGGDEFAVLIGPHEAAADADPLSHRLREVFSQPFTIAGRRLVLGASIGRATFPTNCASADDLLRVADTAMFNDKRAAYRRTNGVAARDLQAGVSPATAA